MAIKRTDIYFTFEVPAGYETRRVAHLERDRAGAQVMVEREHEFPLFEQRVSEFRGLTQAQLADHTEAALLARARETYGPETRAVHTEHKVYIETD